MSLSPLATLCWIDHTGVTDYSPGEELPDSVGGKALGLIRIPPPWTPTFVVASPQLLDDFAQATADSQGAVIDEWCQRVTEALDHVGIGPDSELLIRSNAAKENLEHRGAYSSTRSKQSELSGSLAALLPQLLTAARGSRVGLIFQRYVTHLRYGHLSNERRLVEEFRDAEILSIAPSTGEMTEQAIVYRNWRRSTPAETGELKCGSDDELKDALREPLIFAAQRSIRVHYEWLWDGSRLFIVQADLDSESRDGESPDQVVGTVSEARECSDLEVFRVAGATDASGCEKLEFHVKYRHEGFWQPTFYLLDDASVIASAMNGSPTPELVRDLERLVESPLMIRTSFATESIQLLPRSDLLTSASAVLDWFENACATEIRARKLDVEGLTFLAHHYVPALASAFAHAKPNEQTVLIEALWGIPEGLYYYPCDEYHVFVPSSVDHAAGWDGFTSDSEIKFKSHFVAPDKNGRFQRYRSKRPWDWRPTIRDDVLLFKIAKFTRYLAHKTASPINIMWFLQCRTVDGTQQAIPWYQAKQEVPGDHSEFRRNARDTVITVSTEEDLQALSDKATEKSELSGRLILELSPSEHVALRDECFAEMVGQAAAEHDAVVMLNGARLAHIYYVLARTGAEVVTEPLKGGLDLHQTHHKLVRDKIPSKVTDGGESVRIANLTPEERLWALKIKLVEEAFEVRDADQGSLLEELADVQEVVQALVAAADSSMEEIEHLRAEKAEQRGGFESGVVLLETDAPRQDPKRQSLLESVEAEVSDLVRVTKAGPLERVRHGGSDRRDNPSFAEFVRDVVVSISDPSWKVRFGPIEFGDIDADVGSGSLEAERQGLSLRLRIKLRMGEEQVELPLPNSDHEAKATSGEPTQGEDE